MLSQDNDSVKSVRVHVRACVVEDKVGCVSVINQDFLRSGSTLIPHYHNGQMGMTNLR